MGKKAIKTKKQKQKYLLTLIEDQNRSNERLALNENKLDTGKTSLTSDAMDHDNNKTDFPFPISEQAPKTPSPSRRNLHQRCLSKADSILNLDLDASDHDSIFFTHERVVPGEDGMLFKQAVTVCLLIYKFVVVERD